MIRGLGLDVCGISRMEKLAENETFLGRYFTEAERAYVHDRGAKAPESLAGLFAAKEAFAKAMGTGIAFELRDVEITHDELGRPEYRLHGRAAAMAEGDRLFLSISHDAGTAAAVCVRESDSDLQKDGKASIIDTL